VVFRLKHLEEIAEIMQARRRRQVSEEQRQRLAEIGRQFRFTKKNPLP